MKKKNLVMTAAVMAGCMAMGMTGCSNSSGSAPANGSASNTDKGSAADTSSAENTGFNFDSSRQIYVSAREEGSGTRGAFVELFGIEQKDAEGNKVDMTTVEANVTNSTNVMITTVQGDAYSIGYVSMGSLDESIVKALEIDGVAATVENIKSGDYKVSRPFNIVTTDNLSELAQDFIDYILSAEGQTVVEENGYIASVENAESYSVSGLSGKIVVGGSSSVTPVMEKLAEAYMALNKNANIDVQQTDSSTGVTSAIEGVYDIGMASRDLKDAEKEKGAVGTVIATDGVVVIVNKENPLKGLTSEQVMKIYTGELTDWSTVME